MGKRTKLDRRQAGKKGECSSVGVADEFKSGERSVALITRLQYCEVPYLNEFLDYYFRLGVTRAYLVNTERERHDDICTVIAAKFRHKTQLIDAPDNCDINGCQNIALPLMKEEFVLSMDMDEFLYLNGLSLGEFIDKYAPVDSGARYTGFEFSWVLAPEIRQPYCASIKSIVEQRKFLKRKEVKTLSSRNVIRELEEHRFRYTESGYVRSISIEQDNIFVFHVNSRGLLDTINKIYYQKLQNSKKSRSPTRELKKLFTGGSRAPIPNRFLGLALQRHVLEGKVSNIDFDFPELEFTTDTELLCKISEKMFNEVLGRNVTEAELKVVVTKMEALDVPNGVADEYARGDRNMMGSIALLRRNNWNIAERMYDRLLYTLEQIWRKRLDTNRRAPRWLKRENGIAKDLQ